MSASGPSGPLVSYSCPSATLGSAFLTYSIKLSLLFSYCIFTISEGYVFPDYLEVATAATVSVWSW